MAADVTVVGTGRMGAAMAERLRGAGHPVTVFNRGRQRAEDLAARTGATVAGTPREAAAAADFVVVSPGCARARSCWRPARSRRRP